MSYRSRSGSSNYGGRKSKCSNRTRKKTANAQPAPSTPGITSQMIRDHARRLFRDKWQSQPLSPKEWRLAERDLVRLLEAEAL